MSTSYKPPISSSLTSALTSIPNGPLHGILAVGFDGQVCAAQTLEDLVRHGAMGIKIEQPVNGDPKRHNSSTTTFNTYNAGKFSVTFDDNEKQLKFDLLRHANVIVDNRSPTARKKDATLQKALSNRVNPLVYCAISGFGPENDERAYDRVIQAVSGMANLNGGLINFPLIDISTGKEAAKQIGFALTWLHSLRHKERKRLSFVSLEVSMLAVAFDLLANSIATYLDTKQTTSTIVPFGLYQTSSSKIAIAVAKDEQFATLCDALSIPQLSEHYPTNDLRRKNRTIIEESLQQVLITKSAKEWEEILKEKKIPVGIVKTFQDAIEEHRQQLLRHDHRNGLYVHTPAATSNCFPARTLSLRAAPNLNQDKAEICELVNRLNHAKNPAVFFKKQLSHAQKQANPNKKGGFYARQVRLAELDFDQDKPSVDWAESEFFYARKTGTVFATPASEGEKITTQVDGFILTHNIAKKNDMKITTQQGDQYFLSSTIFAERYETTPNADNSYSPKSIPLKTVKVTQDICILGHWGSKQYLRAGSVIVRREKYDVYGIDSASFSANYMLCPAPQRVPGLR